MKSWKMMELTTVRFLPAVACTPMRRVWRNVRTALAEALEDWLLFRIHKHLALPKIAGIELKVRKERAA